MKRKLTILFAITIGLKLMTGTASYAQTSTAPDSGVRGSGIAAITDSTGAVTPKLVQFDINVAQAGTTVFGTFQWMEATPTAANTFVQPRIIISKKIDTLTISGSVATVTADGYLNDRPATITMICTDDPTGDTIQIDATTIVPPGSAMPVVNYQAVAKVTKGTLVVFSKPATASFARGVGVIHVSPTNDGQFNFTALSAPAGVSGSIHYVDYNKLVLSPMVRPFVVIDVAKIDTLVVTGDTAVITGRGLINGVPANVTLNVADLAPAIKPGVTTTVFDTFAIEADLISATPASAVSWNRQYKASGPVIQGDIVVGTVTATTPPTTTPSTTVVIR
jgi:hypothetical protein